MTTQEKIKQEEDEKYAMIGTLLLIPSLMITAGTFYFLYKWHVFPLTNYALGYWQIFGLRLVVSFTIATFRGLKDGKINKADCEGLKGTIYFAIGMTLLAWFAKWMI